MGEIIKLDVSEHLEKRELVLNWWRSLTDKQRAFYIKKYNLSLLTGSIIQRIYDEKVNRN
mgnify:FL=1